MRIRVGAIRIGAITATAAILAWASGAGAQELWRGAAIGMSKAEVTRMFPLAAEPRTAKLGDEQAEVLEAPGQALEGRPARARFVFRDGALISVQLRSAAVRPAHSRENIAFAKAASDSFTAQYGASHTYDCGDRTFADVASYECGWMSGPLTVKLAYLDVAGQAPQLTVTWRRAGDPNYDL